jgi:hypothetical protein
MSAAGDSATGSALESLRELLRSEGGLIAALVEPGGIDGAGGSSSPASIAARGPRASGSRGEYELLVEAIYEGYLLHYRSPRLLDVPEADLRLLAGDQLYAVGLARLVELGDTIAVAELADTITLGALAQGAGAVELARAVWAAGARAVGWGASRVHLEAKRRVLAGAPDALDAMRTSALAPAASP